MASELLPAPSPPALYQKSAALKLLEKKRELREIDAALGTARKNYEAKCVDMKLKEEALDRREQQLQETMAKFTQMKKDNKRIQERAAQECKDELDVKRPCEESESETRCLKATSESMSLNDKEITNVRYDPFLARASSRKL